MSRSATAIALDMLDERANKLKDLMDKMALLVFSTNEEDSAQFDELMVESKALVSERAALLELIRKVKDEQRSNRR